MTHEHTNTNLPTPKFQANLEIEIKLKNDALKIKKKLEMEYKELEYTLETANKTIADYLREIKKMESELGNLQAALDGETAQKVRLTKMQR